MHIRTEEWYKETFKACSFKIVDDMTKYFDRGEDMIPEMLFCLIP
jgi:hypothetical protein